MKHLFLVTIFVLASTSALAHVTLQQSTATPGQYRAVLQVPHGCTGNPTTELRVRIPAGFSQVKPMPKAGWELEIVKSNDNVTELRWFGGELLDEHYDEFVFRGRIGADVKGEVLVPVLQYCSDQVSRWIAADRSQSYPAPRVRVE